MKVTISLGINEMRLLLQTLTSEVPCMDDDDTMTLQINDRAGRLIISHWTKDDDLVYTLQIEQEQPTNR